MSLETGLREAPCAGRRPVLKANVSQAGAWGGAAIPLMTAATARSSVAELRGVDARTGDDGSGGMAAEGGMGERGLRKAEGGTGTWSDGVSEYGGVGEGVGSEQRERGRGRRGVCVRRRRDGGVRVPGGSEVRREVVRGERQTDNGRAMGPLIRLTGDAASGDPPGG